MFFVNYSPLINICIWPDLMKKLCVQRKKSSNSSVAQLVMETQVVALHLATKIPEETTKDEQKPADDDDNKSGDSFEIVNADDCGNPPEKPKFEKSGKKVTNSRYQAKSTGEEDEAKTESTYVNGRNGSGSSMVGIPDIVDELIYRKKLSSFNKMRTGSEDTDSVSTSNDVDDTDVFDESVAPTGNNDISEQDISLDISEQDTIDVHRIDSGVQSENVEKKSIEKQFSVHRIQVTFVFYVGHM